MALKDTLNAHLVKQAESLVSALFLANTDGDEPSLRQFVSSAKKAFEPTERELLQPFALAVCIKKASSKTVIQKEFVNDAFDTYLKDAGLAILPELVKYPQTYGKALRVQKVSAQISADILRQEFSKVRSKEKEWSNAQDVLLCTLEAPEQLLCWDENGNLFARQLAEYLSDYRENRWRAVLASRSWEGARTFSMVALPPPLKTLFSQYFQELVEKYPNDESSLPLLKELSKACYWFLDGTVGAPIIESAQVKTGCALLPESLLSLSFALGDRDEILRVLPYCYLQLSSEPVLSILPEYTAKAKQCKNGVLISNLPLEERAFTMLAQAFSGGSADLTKMAHAAGYLAQQMTASSLMVGKPGERNKRPLFFSLFKLAARAPKDLVRQQTIHDLIETLLKAGISCSTEIPDTDPVLSIGTALSQNQDLMPFLSIFQKAELVHLLDNGGLEGARPRKKPSL